MVGRSRNSVFHSRSRAMLLRASQLVRRRKRKVELRRGGKARAEGAQAPDWKLLFPDLMSHVLGFLPPRDVCRARAVCKHWNELVSSPVFVRQHLERAGNACMDAPIVAYFDFGNRAPVVGFHTELKRWVRLPAFFSHNKQTYLVAATKGLYVYNVTSQDDKEETWREGDDRWKLYKRSQLVVTNPWTGATKWLPLMLNERGPFYGFVPAQGSVFTLDVVDNGRAYIIACINAGEFCGEVYDSRLGYWTAFDAPLDSAFVNMSWGYNVYRRRVQLMRRCVQLMGRHYFVGHDYCQGIQLSRYIISFNLENRQCDLVYDMLGAELERSPDLRAKLGDRLFVPWHVTTYGNKLVLVDMWSTRTGDGGQILTLDVERKVMNHETLMPRTLARLMVDRFGKGSDIVNVSTGHLLHFFSSKDNKLTTYDFHTKLWQTWPASPLDYKQRSALFGWVDDCLFSFSPSRLVDVQLSLVPV